MTWGAAMMCEVKGEYGGRWRRRGREKRGGGREREKELLKETRKVNSEADEERSYRPRHKRGGRWESMGWAQLWITTVDISGGVLSNEECETAGLCLKGGSILGKIVLSHGKLGVASMITGYSRSDVAYCRTTERHSHAHA